jgi:hypothetical protein
MNRSLKNTAAVMAATALTALAIFSGVELGGAMAGSENAGASTASAQATNVSVIARSGSGTLTCPRTGCTASTCHATTGMPPGQ